MPFLSIAQVEPEIELETFIIKKDSSKVHGRIIEQRDMYTIYDKITFLADGDNEEEKYKPSDILGFKWKYTTYESVDDYFMKVVEKGDKITLYELGDDKSFHHAGGVDANGNFMPSGTSHQITSNYYLKRIGSPLSDVKKMGFRKKYMEYFKDCKRVFEMIKSKTLTYDNIKTIVVLYNRCD